MANAGQNEFQPPQTTTKLTSPTANAPEESSREFHAAEVPGQATIRESTLEKNATLDMVEKYAREHNPAIRSAWEAWRAARTRTTIDRSYENPMIDYMPDTYNMAETRAGPQTGGVAFSQAIPFPGKLTIRGKAAGEQAEAAYENMIAVVQETLRKVWTAYADYYFADRALEVNEETTVLARQFEQIVEAKYKVGKVPEQDVIQSQEQISRLAAKSVDFTQQRNTALGAVNTLLDRAPRAPIGTPVEMGASRAQGAAW